MCRQLKCKLCRGRFFSFKSYATALWRDYTFMHKRGGRALIHYYCLQVQKKQRIFIQTQWLSLFKTGFSVHCKVTVLILLCSQWCETNRGGKSSFHTGDFSRPCGININHLWGHLHYGAISCTKAKPPNADRLPPVAPSTMSARQVNYNAVITIKNASGLKVLLSTK